MTTWIHKVFCTFMGDKSEIGVCWIMAGFAFVLERMKPSRTRRRNKTKYTSTCFPRGRICETALPQGSVLLQTTLWPPSPPPTTAASQRAGQPPPSTAQYQEVIVHGGMLACVHYWRPESAKTRKANVQHRGPV